MANATEWCIDSTHKTCKSLDGKNDAFLFTIVVTSPVTRKGVPVCFFITDAEKTPILSQWLFWVKQTVSALSVKRIMIDCSATEIAAIREAFGDSVDILLCHWHIKRAWETHIKRDVSNLGYICTSRRYTKLILTGFHQA